MVTQKQVAELRRLINEPTTSVFTDLYLTERIEASACDDRFGKTPDDTDWEPTYNLYEAASLLWLEKATKLTEDFDFSADGGSFQRSQKYSMCLKQASAMQSRSKSLSKHLKSHPQTLSETGWDDVAYKDDFDVWEENLK